LPSEPRKRAARGQGAALHGEVLAAAMDLLAETGSEEAVSLRAVAKRVGVSVPAIYLHFADKQALLDAVCEEVFEKLFLALKEGTADATDPFDALRRQGSAYVRFALENPEQYRIVMRGPSTYEPEQEIASGAFGYVIDTVTACIGLGVLEGDPIELSLQLWAGVHGLASLMMDKPLFPWPSVEDVVEATVCRLGWGLAAGSRLETGLPATEYVERMDRLRN
jgi:AcrR family transcriptional regulator